MRRPVYSGKLVWGAKRKGLGPEVVVAREDLRIVDQATWDAVQARLKERGESYLRQAGGKLFRRAELARESQHLWSGFLRCAWCGGSLFVGKKTHRPKVQSWYGCAYHAKRGETVCRNGVYAPVDDLDNALLDGVEKAVLDPVALGYVMDKAAESIRRTLAEDPGHIETLRQRRAETQRKIIRLVEAVADGNPPRSFLEQVKALEGELGRLDGEIATIEAQTRLGHLDVARTLQELEPALAAWRAILRGNPVRGRQVLKKIVAGPIRMEPLPGVQAYRWQGQLNGGAVLEGTQKYLKVRGSGPIIVQNTCPGW